DDHRRCAAVETGRVAGRDRAVLAERGLQLGQYREATMPSDTEKTLQVCNCLALRQAARHVTQFYDQCLAPTGLRTTQFSILAKLKRLGPMTINALARELVMDRTTLGRTMLPLQRDGLIRI